MKFTNLHIYGKFSHIITLMASRPTPRSDRTMQFPLLQAVVALAFLLGLPAVAVEVGQAAPEFEMPGRAGPIRLSDFKGKTVYLDFWASWCGPCKQSFPWMNEMQSRYGAKGLRIVGLNVDQKAEDAKNFLKETPASFDIAFDQAGKTPRAYAVKGMPTSVLIGPDGKVLLVHSGFRGEQQLELEHKIRLALNLKE